MKKNKSLIYYRFLLLIFLFAGLAWLPKERTVTEKRAAGNFPPKEKLGLKAKKKIIFIAGACSHGPGEHEHIAGCRLLAAEINKNMGDVAEATVYDLWPPDTTVLNDASTIVMYMDGGEAHLALKHVKHLDVLMKKGIGLACLHYAVEVPTNAGGPEFKNWLGGYFETFWSVNPTWDAEYKSLPKHPVTNGVTPFTLKDEWYYHMRFQDNMKTVQPILTAIPPASTLDRKDGAHEGNEFVRKELGKPQHMSWVTERKDGGRGFGFTGGHYHKNWGNENVRKLVLNGIAWTAKISIPAKGITTSKLSDTDLTANLDSKPCQRR